MKLFEMLRNSKYKSIDSKLFENYSRNYALDPIHENEQSDLNNKPETEKVVKDKPFTSKPDDKKTVKDKPEIKEPQIKKHDITDKEVIEKDSAYQDIIKYGAYMGEGLYSISEYEYNHDLVVTKDNINNISKGRLDNNTVFFNKLLYTVINRLKPKIGNEKKINNFLRVDPIDFWKGGAIHSIIYDSFNDNIMFYYVNPTKHRHSHVIKGEYEDSYLNYNVRKRDESLTDDQQDLLDSVVELGDDYIRSYRGSPDSRETVLLRYKLLYSLGFTLQYLPPMQIDS